MKFRVLKLVRILSQGHLKLAIGTILFLQFSAPSYAASVVTLAWDASTSRNVTGYMLYYKRGEKIGELKPRYKGKSANEGISSIDVKDKTTHTIKGLEDGETYYFAVTAYDDDSRTESKYSNQECIKCPVDQECIKCPVDVRSTETKKQQASSEDRQPAPATSLSAVAKTKPEKTVKLQLTPEELAVIAPVKLPSGSVMELSRGQVEIIKKQSGVFFGAKAADMLGPGEVVLILPDDLGGGFIYGKPESLARAFSAAGATKGSVPAPHLFQDRGSCLFF